MFSILFDAVIISALTALICSSTEIIKRSSQIADQLEDIADELVELRVILEESVEEEEVKEALSDAPNPYEEERNERIQEFDDRIKKMKEELRRSPSVADELHPLVRNLPHNSVDTSTMIDPYEEYAK